MDAHALIEKHREQINQANVALCLCNYEDAAMMLYLAYSTNRQLLELVNAMKLEARKPDRPAGEVTE